MVHLVADADLEGAEHLRRQNLFQSMSSKSSRGDSQKSQYGSDNQKNVHVDQSNHKVTFDTKVCRGYA